MLTISRVLNVVSSMQKCLTVIIGVQIVQFGISQRLLLNTQYKNGVFMTIIKLELKNFEEKYQLFLTPEEYDAMLVLIGFTHPYTFKANYTAFCDAEFKPKCDKDFDLYDIYSPMYDAR